eukprot:CAMPEP_0198425794 /NCGR_PEP_ID=MMETSP1452-20131203/4811_1 /TAXON_ID=1181717 /ORGANISM="Synchroma pusillum, Strain CCMP3072" /LENGTH=126 /DNA_ID=CAMNT_0044146157 /DNA_START=16 /DNA_END=394 /DNA_ORIENTATION=+
MIRAAQLATAPVTPTVTVSATLHTPQPSAEAADCSVSSVAAPARCSASSPPGACVGGWMNDDDEGSPRGHEPAPNRRGEGWSWRRGRGEDMGPCCGGAAAAAAAAGAAAAGAAAPAAAAAAGAAAA